MMAAKANTAKNHLPTQSDLAHTQVTYLCLEWCFNQTIL